MKETAPKLIGIFVIGGVLLILSALILFSSQEMFTPKRLFYAYFQQSVNGLSVGSAVRFKGIPVGQVIDITGVYYPDDGSMIPRVTLEFLPETLENAIVKEGEYTLLPLLLKNGLRANLQSTSLLTGQLYIALDFHPDKPVRYLGRESDRYPELPTFDSGLDLTIERISELPLEDAFNRVISAFESIEMLLTYPGTKQSIDSFNTLLLDTDTALVDAQDFAYRDLRSGIEEFKQTLEVIRNSADDLNRNFTTVTNKLTEDSLVSVETAMTDLQGTLMLVQQRLSEKNPLNMELRAALREITKAARSASALTDYLEEHPEALLQGKKE